MTVQAATAWRTNAEMIVACRDLGYLHPSDLVLDPTYERGTWWKAWRPPALVALNRDEDGTDFRDLSMFSEGSFGAIAYDPPYCAKGGRRTSGIVEMDERYGQEDAPATPALLQALINDGLTEMARLIRPKGHILVKCMNYVSSGKLWPGIHLTTAHGMSLGLELHDQLIHVGKAGPQPARTRKDGAPVRQHHARNNYSTLLVFRAHR